MFPESAGNGPLLIRRSLVRVQPGALDESPQRPEIEIAIRSGDKACRLLGQRIGQRLTSDLLADAPLVFPQISEALALDVRHLAFDGSRPHVKVRRAIGPDGMDRPKSEHGVRDARCRTTRTELRRHVAGLTPVVAAVEKKWGRLAFPSITGTRSSQGVFHARRVCVHARRRLRRAARARRRAGRLHVWHGRLSRVRLFRECCRSARWQGVRAPSLPRSLATADSA